MESVTLGVDDLFDIGDDAADDYGSVPPMPDLESDMPPMEEENAEGNQDIADGDVLAKLKDIKGAAKRRIIKPQPKLDPTRLIGDRGLPMLMKTFQGIKFKGKGHEASDLKLVMNKLEHWGHRLFPKMTFDEVIDRVEKLGAKREVQTTVKRIRLDMPLLDGEFAPEPAETEEDGLGAGGTEQVNEDELMDAEAAYDEMVRQERAAMEKGNPNRSADEHLTSPQRHSEGPAMSQSFTNSTQTPRTPTVQNTPNKQGLTPEQKERLERNKLRALEKKAARLGVPVSTLLPPKPQDKPVEDNIDPTHNGLSQNTSQQTAGMEDDIITRNKDKASDIDKTSESPFNKTGDNVNKISDKALSSTENLIEDEEMQTEDEILNALDLDMMEECDLVSGGSGAVSQSKEVNDESSLGETERRQVKMCSEPVFDSVAMEVPSVSTDNTQSETQDLIIDTEQQQSDTGSSNNQLITDINSDEIDPKTELSPAETSPQVKIQKDKPNSPQPEKTEEDLTRKSSCEGEDLQLHFSESDTTNTTQEEEDIEKTFKDNINSVNSEK